MRWKNAKRAMTSMMMMVAVGFFSACGCPAGHTGEVQPELNTESGDLTGTTKSGTTQTGANLTCEGLCACIKQCSLDDLDCHEACLAPYEESKTQTGGCMMICDAERIEIETGGESEEVELPCEESEVPCENENSNENPEGPDPQELFVQDYMHGGNACPQASGAQVVYSADSGSLVLYFDAMEAQAGDGHSRDYQFCQFAVTMNVPAGWSYAVDRVSYAGSRLLAEGAEATHAASFYFAGDSTTTRLGGGIEGAVDGEFSYEEYLGDEILTWSGCGPNADPVNLKIQARVHTDPEQPAFLRIDSDKVFGLRWRRCQ